MNASNNAPSPGWIDPDDAPELTDEFFTQADGFVGGKLVRRGRPKAEVPKLTLTVRYDADVVAAFKATGKGWQTRMNAALRDWLKSNSLAELIAWSVITLLSGAPTGSLSSRVVGALLCWVYIVIRFGAFVDGSATPRPPLSGGAKVGRPCQGGAAVRTPYKSGEVAVCSSP